MSNKSISKGKARKLAKSLMRENENGVTWRALESRYNVAAGTLCRIAKSGGEWLPKSDDILIALGLITQRSPYAVMPRWWKRTPEAVKEFTETKNRVKELSDRTRDAQRDYERRKVNPNDKK